MTLVVDRRAGTEQQLGDLLTHLEQQQKTGTLRLSSGDGRVKYIYVKRGIVELLKATRSRTLIGKALLKRHKLTAAQLDAALERQGAADNSLRLGEILVGMGIVKESDVHQALAYQIAEEIFELFTFERLEGELVRGEPPLDIFEREDLQARVSLSPVALANQAVKRAAELEEIRRTIPSKQDVFAPARSAYRPELEQNPAVREVLAALDGKRTVNEFLDHACAPDLVALRILARMVHEGDAAPLTPAELVALGQEFEERGELDAARERYRRAEDLHHPDFDLPRRIGQIDEALGQTAEACRRYVGYADACAQAGYPDVAIATLARVLDLDVAQIQARERLAELLAKRSRDQEAAGDSEAAATSREAAEHWELLLAAAQTPEDRQRFLTELTALLPERDDLREQMAEVSLELGDTAQAVIELQELAIQALLAQQLERAVEILERIVVLDPEEIMAIQSLGDTYAKLGKKDKAVEQYLAFAKSLEESGLAAASADTLVELYEKVVELDPGNTAARRFLATAYEGRENAEKAYGHLAGVVDSLRGGEGQEQEFYEALCKLSASRPADLDVALERARVAAQLGHEEEAGKVFRQVAVAAQLKGENDRSAAAWKELLKRSPGDLEGQLALAKLQVNLKGEHKEAAARCAAVFELALVSGSEDTAYEAVKQALDIEPDEPRHRERLARIQVLRGRTEEAARTLTRAARRARDDEDFGLARTWARQALELDATCDDARDLLENLRRAPAAAAQQGGFHQGGARRQTVKATITGGAPKASIEGVTTKKRVGNIADRLRNMKLGPSAPTTSPKETKKLSRKANSAMSKLRALRGGGSSDAGPGLAAGAPEPATNTVSKGPEAPGEAMDAGTSKKAKSSLSKLRAMRGGGSGGQQPEGEKKVSKGPEAPGQAVDAGTSKKASSALNRLRAMRTGGGDSETAPALSPNQQVSKGPEAPGQVIDAGTSKKASSALNRLKALRSGGGSPAAAPAAGEKKASKGPEAPGEAVDAATSKKASSALNRLKALRSGGGSPAAAPAAGEKKASKGPEAPGEAVDAATSKKASSALNRLKALRSGGGSPAAAPAAGEKKASKGPEAPGEAVDAATSKKASSALNRLKALRSGGGSPAAAPAAGAKPASKGPEAPGEAVDPATSKKASSALNRLKALRSGGGSPAAAPAAGEKKASKGPEAPGEPVDAATSKKASSALSRLKALRSGGSNPSPSPGGITPDQKVSKGPEAAGEVVDAATSKKASSAMSRLRALKAGGDG